MGGGGAMRTAAKLAGIGVGKAGIRGFPTPHPTEQSVRNASRPVSAVVSSQGARAAEVAPLHTAASWDMDDWEFADGGELIMQAGEPMPRAVFDAVPSFQEAKAATTELKDAIDKMYLSCNFSQCEDSFPGSQVSVLSPTHSESETKSCVIEAISNPSVPKHALQAFQLLSSSTEAQTVVASLACDKNVWNAVMQNPAVTDFFRSHQTEETPEKVKELANCAAVAGVEAEEAPKEVEELPESNSGNGFVDFEAFLQNVKLTVVQMVSRVSSYFQNLFGPSPAEKLSADDANGNTKANFMDNKTTMGGTFMGLAVLAVMVVLLKRT